MGENHSGDKMPRYSADCHASRVQTVMLLAEDIKYLDEASECHFASNMFECGRRDERRPEVEAKTELKSCIKSLHQINQLF